MWFKNNGQIERLKKKIKRKKRPARNNINVKVKKMIEEFYGKA